jgi:hypothetical protein
MSKLLILQTDSAFHQLTDAINQLEHVDYKRPLENLSGSSVGQHVRHIIEFYQCMMNGYKNASINYDLRVRDKMIEESREFAIQCINKIMFEIQSADLKKPLVLEVSYENGIENNSIQLPTSFERELVYNIEHAIHHMALIKIGIKEINSEIILPVEFGVAASTIKHKHQNHVHSNVLTQS